MVAIHNLGFPRIGKQRELKHALEGYWQGQSTETKLQETAADLRRRHWQDQSKLDLVPVADFSLYDQVLDMSETLGNIPSRAQQSDELATYFRAARGQAPGDESCHCVAAGEMTKWFDTNYHYIVPEFHEGTEFHLNAQRILQQVAEAQSQGHAIKPVIIGPLSYLWLGKSNDNGHKLALLDRLLPAYGELLNQLAKAGVTWVQIDEPILVTDLESEWKQAFLQAYHALKTNRINILIATYFGALQDNLQLACELPVQGLHVDAVRAPQEVERVVDWLPTHKVLSLGIIDGRNIWKSDLNTILDWLEPIAQKLKDRLWIAPSCSLLHVPVDLDSEQQLDPEIRNWLAFAQQKIEELVILKTALTQSRQAVDTELAENQAAINSRQQSKRVHQNEVKKRLAAWRSELGNRASSFSHRKQIQAQHIQLPALPTTTIGSFPQTADIRQTRKAFKQGVLAREQYVAAMEAHIKQAIEEQETIGLDVLVHGEAERNDMVEYFGQQLFGFTFTDYAWVQSYGSRCVKPPIIYGDVQRPQSMTVDWIRYAQSLTDKPVKGMLTGPVTILNWSFVRDDQAESETCQQIALAIRDEVLDLEAAGINIIQIDEAALREGLPLRKSQWQHYLNWAVGSFRVCANGVADETQIHTHMCYSEFNDIIEAIAHMDADVITIETSRSHMELLQAFDDFQYPNDIGPGVYDIHSPNVPSIEDIKHLLLEAKKRIPVEQLWVNPDCGLKTRQWPEVKAALENMVSAAQSLREEIKQSA